MNKVVLYIAFIVGISFQSFAQDDDVLIIKDTVSEKEVYLAALKPAKAGFYSAILPGLGQAYNKKYWKIPIVYGLLATSSYFFVVNNTKYHEYRDAFKLHKLGEGAVSQYPDLDILVLQKAQKYHKKNRDLSMMITAGLYLLQIVEASVDAHLEFHNTDSNLGISPSIFQEPVSGNMVVATTLKFRF